MKKIMIFIVVLLLITGCENKNDLIKYESELVKFDFSKYVKNSSGSIEDDYANIIFELNEAGIDDFKQGFKEKVDLLDTEDLNNLEGTMIYGKINDFCKKDNIVQLYQTLTAGKVIKTRDIFITLCYKDNGYYLNIIG